MLSRSFQVIITILFFVTICLVGYQAKFSHQNNPDEVHNVTAVAWYADHMLPAPIGDASAKATYDRRYGTSRLNDLGVAYFLMGRLSAALGPQRVPPLSAGRLSQFLIFSLLVVAALSAVWQQSSSIWVYIIPLCTPQAWYLFSYVNDDALPLALSILLTASLVEPGGRFSRFLKGDLSAAATMSGVLWGATQGVLTISKTNYIVFVLFAWVVVLFEDFPLALFKCRLPKMNKALRPLAVIMVATGLIVGTRLGIDHVINGGDRNAKIESTIERLAIYKFRPSTARKDPSAAYERWHVRDQGMEIGTMLDRYDWFKYTFYSFCGLYGYLQFGAADWYFGVMGGIYLVLVITVCYPLLKNNPRLLNPVILVALCACAMVTASVLLSWTDDVQRQGRYLFPMLAIFGWLTALGSKRLNARLMKICVFLAFGLGAWSFISFAGGWPHTPLVEGHIFSWVIR